MKKIALFQLHIAVLLWGFTGIFGNAIQLQEMPLVWWRILFTGLISGILVLGISIYKKKKLAFQNMNRIIITSAFIMVHWLCFYGSIKHSNVSIALCCLSLSALASSIFSPILFDSKFKPKEFFSGLLSMLGVLIILNFQFNFFYGIFLGIIAAILSAIFTLYNEDLCQKNDPLELTFIEMCFAFGMLSLMMPFFIYNKPIEAMIPSMRDFGLLVLFSGFCTVMPIVLSFYAMRHVNAFTVNLTVNLEPVYGILAAFYFFKEYDQLNSGFYLGLSFILLSLFLHIFLKQNTLKNVK